MAEIQRVPQVGSASGRADESAEQFALVNLGKIRGQVFLDLRAHSRFKVLNNLVVDLLAGGEIAAFDIATAQEVVHLFGQLLAEPFAAFECDVVPFAR
jgi:hypothetical protein